MVYLEYLIFELLFFFSVFCFPVFSVVIISIWIDSHPTQEPTDAKFLFMSVNKLVLV